MGALTFQQRLKLSPRIIVSQFILSLSIQYSVSLNNNERESSLTRLCGTNPVENSRKRRKAGPRFQIPLESREHWFFLLDIGNSNSRSARGIFREQRKCSLVLNRVANYYRARETSTKREPARFKGTSRIQFPIFRGDTEWNFYSPPENRESWFSMHRNLRVCKREEEVFGALQLGRSLSWPRWMSRDVSPLDLPFLELRQGVD